MYTCILDGIQLCMYRMYAYLDNRYMGWDIHLSHGHVICILLKQTYLQTCLMGIHVQIQAHIYAQLSSHDARPYALSVCHSGWRQVLPISIPIQYFTGNTFGHSKNPVQSPLQYILIQTWFLYASDLLPIPKILKYGSRYTQSSLLVIHNKVLITSDRCLMWSETSWGHYPITTLQGALF